MMITTPQNAAGSTCFLYNRDSSSTFCDEISRLQAQVASPRELEAICYTFLLFPFAVPFAMPLQKYLHGHLRFNC